MRLSSATLGVVPSGIDRFGYDRSTQAIGIVHFGIGAFHRTHQAWYTDRTMDGGDRDWMISGISLRSADVANQMNPQDGLYSVVERSAEREHIRVVGAVREVLVGHKDAAVVRARLAAPSTHIVSFTITEKGYCRSADRSLDPQQGGPGSIYHHLAAAFRLRRDAGLAGLTLVSCDNLADNGPQLRGLVAEYLDRHAPELRSWFEAECSCPATMVDRIVPATTSSDLIAAEQRLGLRDDAAVVTEPFSQWVVEDRFAGPRPRWETVGAELVSDVAPYETAKLRMLNGAHSALAYLGLERGYTYVHQAIADPKLRPIIEQLISREAATSFAPAVGQDLSAYASDLVARFENSVLNHRLDQIAMDGSQKIPQRWLATLADQQKKGRSCPAILSALGAWLRHLRDENDTVRDPLAARLKRAWAGADISQVARVILGPTGILRSEWHMSDADIHLMHGLG